MLGSALVSEQSPDPPLRISRWAVGATYREQPICLARSPSPPRHEVPSLEQCRPGEHKTTCCTITVDPVLKMCKREGANISLPGCQG